jgi:hypothetical protein
MTVKEFKKELEKLKEEDELIVYVRALNKTRSIAQITPFEVDAIGVWVTLPFGVSIHEKKEHKP